MAQEMKQQKLMAVPMFSRLITILHKFVVLLWKQVNVKQNKKLLKNFTYFWIRSEIQSNKSLQNDNGDDRCNIVQNKTT